MTCNAELHIGDDFGDNHATMRCQLEEGHEGPHEKRFARGEGKVVVTWDDEARDDPQP